MPLDPSYKDSVEFFQRAFTIVLALALGEAFKQFVADKAIEPEDQVLHWDRLPSLLSFLFLIFPFFHGMSRHFYTAYLSSPTIGEFYSFLLMIDGVVFLVESAIFFTMSRALSAGQWRRYFWSILILMCVDTLWAMVALWRGAPVLSWIALNFVLAGALFPVLQLFKGPPKSLYPPIHCAAVTFTTTVLSYFFMWNFYFHRT